MSPTPGRIPVLIPDNNFPTQAIQESVHGTNPVAGTTGVSGPILLTWNLASAADAIIPWGRAPYQRDRQLRDFFPTEPFLASSLAAVSSLYAGFEWEIRGASTKVEDILTDMLQSAIAGDTIGYRPFVLKFSQDIQAQDNGAFIELIREPTLDAASRFKDERAPVLGIGHLDSNRCTRTGDPATPVVYTDKNGKQHALKWFQVIPFSDYPSAIESMNGIGYCGVTRCLRLAQIMRSILIFKDEKISGRHFKTINIVSGVSRTDIDTIQKRGKEEADNAGLIRYIDPAILTSLDPEKPVSKVTIDLANLPDGFDYDQEMKWYVTGLALALGVDYQDLAPLSSGSIGSGTQSQILSQKSARRGPAMFMKIADAFANYGVFPAGYQMVFEDRDEQRELDKQTLRKLFQEEMALAIRNYEFPPETALKIGVARGLYKEADFADVPKGYGLGLLFGGKQTLGNQGGNTMAEDAGRTPAGAQDNSIGNRLMKAFRGRK